MMRKRSIILTLLLFNLTVSAQQEDSLFIRSLANDILRNGTAYANLRILCKKIGPRLSGSPQAEKAVQETFRMMKEMGADSVYLQECMVPHWVRGAKEEAKIILAGGKEYPLKACALGNSIGTPPAGIKGNVIEVRSFKELDSLGNDRIRGNIVFYNYPMNPAYINSFQAYGEAGAYRGRGPSQAARYGAIGVIIRSLASNLDDHPHTGSTSYVDSFQRIPAIAISTNDAEWLSSALKKKVASQAYFKTNCQMLPDVLSHNVVGELKGVEFPDEVITIGGHLDSWDLAEGAHDDGAGCVQSMEVIRTFKALGIKPKRTIRVVMFMNEENGLRGGAKYAELAKIEGKKQLFALESDAGGFTPRGFGLSMRPDQKAKLIQWKSLFYPYGVYDFTDGGGGADIGPLRGLGTALAGLSPDTQRYFDIHHAETDVFEAVSPRELLLGAINMTALVYLVDKYGL